MLIWLQRFICHVVVHHFRSKPTCLWRQLGGAPKQENHQSREWSGSQQTGQQLQGKKSEGFPLQIESGLSSAEQAKLFITQTSCFFCVCVSQFGFRKWKSHVTERPFEDRSEVVKELYSELNVIRPHTGPGTDFCACVVRTVCVHMSVFKQYWHALMYTEILLSILAAKRSLTIEILV